MSHHTFLLTEAISGLRTNEEAEGSHSLVLWIRNDGCDNLEPRKVYQVITDAEAERKVSCGGGSSGARLTCAPAAGRMSWSLLVRWSFWRTPALCRLPLSAIVIRRKASWNEQTSQID